MEYRPRIPHCNFDLANSLYGNCCISKTISARRSAEVSKSSQRNPLRFPFAWKGWKSTLSSSFIAFSEREPFLRGFLCGSLGSFWSQWCIWVSSQCAFDWCNTCFWCKSSKFDCVPWNFRISPKKSKMPLFQTGILNEMCLLKTQNVQKIWCFVRNKHGKDLKTKCFFNVHG